MLRPLSMGRRYRVKILLTVATYFASLVVVTAIAFVVVIITAGPHAGLLPQWMEAIILAMGWATVLVAPVVIARKVWRAKK